MPKLFVAANSVIDTAGHMQIVYDERTPPKIDQTQNKFNSWLH